MSAETDQGAPFSARDAAFLAEMGIAPLWQARAVAVTEAAPATVPETLVADVAAVEAVESPEADLDQMDWRALNEAIAQCARCGCKDGRKPVLGDGARAAVWMVMAGATTSADEAERSPLAGAPGKLLDNMLAAVQLSREQNVYVTNLVKCRPVSASGGERAPTSEEVAACRPFVERELALCSAGVVLTLGQVATNALLGQPQQQALAASRGAVHAINGAALVATLHPGELLRRGGDKAQAWADLCLARASHGQPR